MFPDLFGVAIDLREKFRLERITLSMAQAVFRSLAVNAARGQLRAAQAFIAVLSGAERANKVGTMNISKRPSHTKSNGRASSNGVVNQERPGPSLCRIPTASLSTCEPAPLLLAGRCQRKTKRKGIE